MHDKSDTRRPARRSPRLPRNQQRERVLRLVGAANGVVDAGEIAERMQLHVTTVRFHLDALCEDGAVARTRIKRDGVGRPRTGYIAVRDRLDYRSLAEILAMELGDTADERRERAERAGLRWAERILSAAADDPAGRKGAVNGSGVDACADRITEVFERMGFGPEIVTDPHNTVGQRTIQLNACPVRDLARSHPEVSCAMHRGLLRGLLADHDGDQTDLAPFVEPEVCIAKITRR